MLLSVLTRIAAFCMKILTAGTSFVDDLWDGLETIVTKVISFFGTLFSNIVSIFWTSGTGLTTVGVLFLISMAVGFFWLAIRFITGLVRGMKGRR